MIITKKYGIIQNQTRRLAPPGLMRDFLEIGADIKEFDAPELKLWDEVAKSLPELIACKGLRDQVVHLPTIQVQDYANDLGTVKRLYTMITFIAHGFIHEGPKVDVNKLNLLDSFQINKI
jgi:hypothetical protein